MTAFSLLPAIDILDGRAVRLSQGRRDSLTLDGGRPDALARRWAADGATMLHVVDLDGAFTGRPTPGLVSMLAAETELPLQVGGGYRTLADIADALDHGAARVMVGTAALDPIFLTEAAEAFGERLIVAVDARDGRVAVAGWLDETDVAPDDLARRCADAGVHRLLVTSTRRDGSLAGPDVDLLADVLPAGLPVLAAGGIADVGDLLELRRIGCEGAVVGSALLAGRFTLAEARAALEAA